MEENAQFINKTIKFVCNKLDKEQINYYIAGAIGGYIDAGLPIQRIHDDLDIMIEEKDVSKLSNIFKNTEYEFHDNRLTSNKTLNEHGYTDGDHEVYAMHKNSAFHIGFFLFHYDDKSFTISEYFKDGNKQKKLERSLPIEIFDHQYNNKKTNYLGVDVKVVRKELIYKNKKVMNREKDLYDIKKLEPKIDEQLLNNLKGLSSLRKTKILDV